MGRGGGGDIFVYSFIHYSFSYKLIVHRNFGSDAYPLIFFFHISSDSFIHKYLALLSEIALSLFGVPPNILPPICSDSEYVKRNWCDEMRWYEKRAYLCTQMSAGMKPYYNRTSYDVRTK